MKIALVCCGLEHIQRGFESFSRELFVNYSSDEVTIDLYKGSGKAGKNEYVIRCVRRNSYLLRLLGSTDKAKYYKYKIECWSFAIGMIPFLFRKKYDIIYFSDNEFGKALIHIRKVFKLKYKILFSNGAPWHAGECRLFDGVQELTRHMQLLNIADGVSPNNSFYVPYGINVSAYDLTLFNKKKIRREFGIPESSFVILSLSALKITHKRVDWLIKEVAKLDDKFFLVMSGANDEETPELQRIAHAALDQTKFKFLTVGYSKVIRLLACADLMVSTSLSEAFGRVLLETVAAKLPVLSHPHYAAKEIIMHESCFTDMRIEGMLATKIRLLEADPAKARESALKNFQHCRAVYDWQTLNAEYTAMYKSVLNYST